MSSLSYQPLNDPEGETPRQSQFHIVDPNVEQLEKRDQAIKTRVRKLRIVIRILAFACSVVVVSLMIANLVVFYETAQRVANGVRLWPQNAKVWPTYLTLGVAALSTILATVTLFAYFWGTKVANRWNMARTSVTIAFVVFNIVIWAIAAFGLQSTSGFDGVGSQSLWSAVCDSTDQQHEIFGHEFNFDQYCLMQEWALVCAGIGIGLEGLTVVSYIYVMMRIRHKRHLKRATLNPPVYVEPPSPVPSPFLDAKHPQNYNVSQQSLDYRDPQERW